MEKENLEKANILLVFIERIEKHEKELISPNAIIVSDEAGPLYPYLEESHRKAIYDIVVNAILDKKEKYQKEFKEL